MEKKVNDYYTKYFKDWLFLQNIDIKTALEMIKKKSETEIRGIISLSYNEIEHLPAKYDIELTDSLSCEIKEGTILTEREKEFFALVKSGCSLKEISAKLMCSENVVKTNIKIFIAKLLIGLYPNLKKCFNFFIHKNILSFSRYPV